MIQIVSYGDSLVVLDIKLRLVDDFEHGDLGRLMWTSVWIGSRMAAKLCGDMTFRVRFVCYISMMWDGFSSLYCGGTGELEVQFFRLSHFHELSMLELLLIGARIVRVVA